MGGGGLGGGDVSEGGCRGGEGGGGEGGGTLGGLGGADGGGSCPGKKGGGGEGGGGKGGGGNGDGNMDKGGNDGVGGVGGGDTVGTERVAAVRARVATGFCDLQREVGPAGELAVALDVTDDLGVLEHRGQAASMTAESFSTMSMYSSLALYRTFSRRHGTEPSVACGSASPTCEPPVTAATIDFILPGCSTRVISLRTTCRSRTNRHHLPRWVASQLRSYETSTVHAFKNVSQVTFIKTRKLPRSGLRVTQPPSRTVTLTDSIYRMGGPG